MENKSHAIGVPDSTTRSTSLRPLLANNCFRLVKLADAGGMLLLTSDARETTPSLLPVYTSHRSFLYCIIVLKTCKMGGKWLY